MRFLAITLLILCTALHSCLRVVDDEESGLQVDMKDDAFMSYTEDERSRESTLKSSRSAMSNKAASTTSNPLPYLSTCHTQ